MSSTTRESRTQSSAIWLAAGLLVLGVLVYALDRGGTAYFLPDWLARAPGPAVFGTLGAHLPTFVHPFAFVLMTAAVVRPGPRGLLLVCSAWFAIDCAFEVGQWSPLGQRIAASIPDWFDGVPVLEATGAYFSRGTFDPLDILSIALGVVAAYLVFRFAQRGDNP
ncbi:MAG: hypothetical protein KJO76_11170 [Gammaproteobacteria bacterium]|nr:hypothetical protein [Gammaproteobacteria bacterium]